MVVDAVEKGAGAVFARVLVFGLLTAAAGCCFCISVRGSILRRSPCSVSGFIYAISVQNDN